MVRLFLKVDVVMEIGDAVRVKCIFPQSPKEVKSKKEIENEKPLNGIPIISADTDIKRHHVACNPLKVEVTNPKHQTN